MPNNYDDINEMLRLYRENCIMYEIQVLEAGLDLSNISVIADKLLTFGEWYVKHTGEKLPQQYSDMYTIKFFPINILIT